MPTHATPLRPIANLLEEFQNFAVKGNVVDLAVGVIIGTAFGAVVSSLVNDVITPPLGYLIGKVNFEQLAWTIPTDEEPVSIRYGLFLMTIVSFLVKAWAMFVVVRMMNRLLRAKEEAAQQPGAEQTPALSTQERLLTEIRDALRDRGTADAPRTAP